MIPVETGSAEEPSPGNEISVRQETEGSGKKAMERAYMIYHPEEAVKNRRFIQMFREQGEKQGLSFFAVSSQEYDKTELWDIPALVLNRTRDAEVSRRYEAENIPVFHRTRFVELANDKDKMLRYFEQNLPEAVTSRRWCPKSIRIPAAAMAELVGLSGRQREDRLDMLCDGRELWRDGVIKSLDGHGGSEVFLAAETAQWEEALAGKDVLLQERIDSDGRDLRIYVLGGEIYQAVLRTGDGDFRSNYSLGGNVCPREMTAQEQDWIYAFLHAMPREWQGMYGIDFLVDREGCLVFNEVEEMVGCRMLYQCTNRDIVKDYVFWLKTFV